MHRRALPLYNRHVSGHSKKSSPPPCRIIVCFSIQNSPYSFPCDNDTDRVADLCGFTPWASAREPSQVFSLLETVYNGFDLIAKRRRVYKAETAKDTYTAVAGLPEPRSDHAVVMTRYANECCKKFQFLVRALEKHLGPETGDLGCRFGLHSGQVVGGVLRGDKGRYQLFGAGVDIATSMEATGVSALFLHTFISSYTSH